MKDGRTYKEFWPHYLAQHATPANRWLHFLGTGLGLLSLIFGLVLWEVVLIVLGPVVAFGLAWLGHFFVERNMPAAFGNPVWSVFSDLRMLGLWLSGRLSAELRRHRIERR